MVPSYPCNLWFETVFECHVEQKNWHDDLIFVWGILTPIFALHQASNSLYPDLIMSSNGTASSTALLAYHLDLRSRCPPFPIMGYRIMEFSGKWPLFKNCFAPPKLQPPFYWIPKLFFCNLILRHQMGVLWIHWLFNVIHGTMGGG